MLFAVDGFGITSRTKSTFGFGAAVDSNKLLLTCSKAFPISVKVGNFFFETGLIFFSVSTQAAVFFYHVCQSPIC